MSEISNLMELGTVLPRLFKSFSFEDLKEFALINSQTHSMVEEFSRIHLQKKYGHTIKYLKTWLLSFEYASQKYWINGMECTVPQEPNGYVSTFDGDLMLLSNGSLYRTFPVYSGKSSIHIANDVSDFSHTTFIQNGELMGLDSSTNNQLVPVVHRDMSDIEHPDYIGKRPKGADLKFFGEFGVDSENYLYNIIQYDEIYCLGQLPVTPIQIALHSVEQYDNEHLMIGADFHIYLIDTSNILTQIQIGRAHV